MSTAAGVERWATVAALLVVCLTSGFVADRMAALHARLADLPPQPSSPPGRTSSGLDVLLDALFSLPAAAQRPALLLCSALAERAPSGAPSGLDAGVFALPRLAALSGWPARRGALVQHRADAAAAALRQHYRRSFGYETAGAFDAAPLRRHFGPAPAPPKRFLSDAALAQLGSLLASGRISGAELNRPLRDYVKRELVDWWQRCLAGGGVRKSLISDPGAWGRLGFGARLLGGLLAVNSALADDTSGCTRLYGLARLSGLVAPPPQTDTAAEVFERRSARAGSWMPDDLRRLLSPVHSDAQAWWFSVLAGTLVRWDDELLLAQRLYANRTRAAPLLPLVAVHVRRTDKVARGEMTLQPSVAYLDALLRRWPEYRRRAVEIYVATDEPAVVAELRTFVARFGLNFTLTSNKQHISSAHPTVLRHDPVSFALDAHAIASAQVLVCTLSSNLCRYAMLAMMDDGVFDPLASGNLISLDSGWYI